jgi:predicted P-loop ATPase
MPMRDFKLEFQEIDQSYSHMDLQRTLRGHVKQSVGNLVTVLLNPKYSKAKKLYEGRIFYDKFTNEIKIQGKIIGEKGIKPNQIRLWDDSLNNRLGLEIEKHFDLNYNANKMWEAIRFVANQYEVSPPKQYLESLKWGGDEGAIGKLLPTYLGAEDTYLNAWIMEHMILGLIKRVMEPGSKFDEMMVLVGGQGIGKSTFARYLAIEEDWFCTIENIQGKDVVMNLMGKTVVEIEEFVALRNAKSANEAKSFLSKLSDRIRIPYEKFSTDVPRTCILIGTLNERTFLNDHTGERRYLPVECFKDKRTRAIYPDKDYLGDLSEKEYIDSIKEDFNQALAYGYKLYKEKKHSWTLPKELLEDLYKEQEKFKYLNPDVEDIRYFLEEYKPRSREPNITCFKELLMQGYQVKSKSFSEIMDNYFPEWKVIRSSKTKRISPSGVSIPVKLYYEKQEGKEEFTEVIDSDLPEEWGKQEQLEIDTGEE